MKTTLPLPSRTQRLKAAIVFDRDITIEKRIKSPEFNKNNKFFG
jgi:hypothetical protein